MILYELLTGVSPFARETYAATIDQVQNHEPPLATKLRREVSQDLSAICQCALRKEIAGRYSTAQELADDLGRWLTGQPVRARAIGPAGKVWRWSKRNPLPSAMACLICVALVWSLWQNQRLGDALGLSETLRAEADIARVSLQETNAKYREEVYVQDMILAFDVWNNRLAVDVRRLLDKHIPEAGETDQRGFEWYALSRFIRHEEPREFAGHSDEVCDLAVAPDGTTFLTVSKDNTLRHWDLETGEEIFQRTPGSSPLRAVAFGPNGREYWTGVDLLKSFHLSDGEPARLRPTHSHEYGILAVAVSPNGRYLASTRFQHDVQLKSIDLDEKYKKTRLLTPSYRCTRIDFSPDNRYLFLSEEPRDPQIHGQFMVWDIERQQFAVDLPTDSLPGSLDASPDGTHVAVCTDSELKLYNVESQQWAAHSPKFRGSLRDCDYSPDGRFVACGADDGTLAVVKTVYGQLHPELSLTFSTRPYPDEIKTLAWVGSNQILTGDVAGRILLHQVPTPWERHRRLYTVEQQFVCRGSRLLCHGDQGLQLLDIVTDEPVLVREFKNERITEAAVDITGRWLAMVIGHENKVHGWDLHKNRVAWTVVHDFPNPTERTNQINDVAFSPDGKVLATIGSVDETIQLWDVATQTRIKTIGVGDTGHLVSYSPDGECLFYASTEASYMCRISDDSVTLVANEGVAVKPFWVTNSEVLLVYDDDTMVRMDVRSGEHVMQFENKTTRARHLTATPDGRTVVTRGRRTLHFWHGASGRHMGQLPISTTNVSFSPDGSSLQIVADHDTWQELRSVSR